jgi:hypothetical protein
MKLMIRLLTLGSLCGVYAFAQQEAPTVKRGPTPMCITHFSNGSTCCGQLCTANGCSGTCTGS